MDRAELRVVSMRWKLNGVAIVNEHIAREVARIYSIEAHGTAYLILRLFYWGRI